MQKIITLHQIGNYVSPDTLEEFEAIRNLYGSMPSDQLAVYPFRGCPLIVDEETYNPFTNAQVVEAVELEIYNLRRR